MAVKLPKYKTRGLITARPAEPPIAATTRTIDFHVDWVPGLKFRNSSETAAVCVTPVRRDPQLAGLHLAPDAAVDLAEQLANAAKVASSVEIDNHKDGDPQRWECFTRTDAELLAQWLKSAASGH